VVSNVFKIFKWLRGKTCGLHLQQVANISGVNMYAASLSETTLSLTNYKTISYLLRIENIAEFHIVAHSINYHVDCTWKYIYMYMYTYIVQYIELHFL